MPKIMANRHLSRSIVLQTLFEWDFSLSEKKNSEQDIKEDLKRNLKEFAPGHEDDDFVFLLIDQVLKKRAVVDEIIEKAAPDWPIDKISIADRNILRIGLYELLFSDRKEVPAKVAINEAIELAKTFGGSRHASLRRYVTKSKKRCALLVFEKPMMNGEFSAEVRNYFQSPSFTTEFGLLQWPSKCGLDFQFIKEAKFGAKFHEKGQITLAVANGEFVAFSYHYFNNTYNIFVLLMPPGEKIRSRTTIVAR